ncbi:hypothetical protein [Lacisediminihabitans sp.]|uniref:hypothetical protein n=1 Tax=Lacisediminihabitans sp. TaxID=2787631 RepID=UPI00374C8BFD
MSEPDALVAPQASFVMALPPGWSRLPVRERERPLLLALIEEIVADALPASLPRDSAEPWRGELRKRLTGAALEARDAGATAVYLPTRPVDGFTAPASLIETEVEDDGLASPAEVIAAVLSDPHIDATEATVDGASALRTDTTTTRVQQSGDWPEVATRQVVYTIEVPHREGRWVVMSFSAVSGDNPSQDLSDALVLLFDALMTTFRWTDVPGVDPSDLESRLAEIASR